MTGDDDDSDATIIRVVARPAPTAEPLAPALEAHAMPPADDAAAPVPPEPEPEPEPPPAPPPVAPLRDDVLRGAYFTAAHAAVAERLASLIAGQTDTLLAWFGSDAAPALARDPARLIAPVSYTHLKSQAAGHQGGCSCQPDRNRRLFPPY